MPIETRAFNLFTLLRRSDEVPGMWFAEIPDIETIVRGRTPSEAIAAAYEAAEMLIIEDLNAGRDPLRFRSTEPEEEAVRLMGEILRTSPLQMVTPAMLDDAAGTISAIVVQLPFRAHRETHEVTESAIGAWPRRRDESNEEHCAGV